MQYASLIIVAAIVLQLGLPSLSAASDPSKLVYVTGSTKKICQLTGDFDRSLGKPTLNQTGKRFGIIGTDLGSSFEYHGKLFFLFGDTWGRPGSRDVLAWTTSQDPSHILLNCYLAKDGKWLPITVPGVSLGSFEVPSGGVSIGGKIYIVVTTDWSAQTGIMGKSVLAVSADNGKTFQSLYDLSAHNFINVSFWQSGGWLYIFGSGPYRKSSVYLARIKPDKLSDRSQLRYLDGLNASGQPQWSPREQDATPIFQHNVVGEFSVAYCDPIKRYVLLYNSSNPRGILMRSSLTPWGPWSDDVTIFEPWRDHGYGGFMHISSSFPTKKPDALSDPGRDAEWGGEYGPYLMARYTTGSAGQCRIFYTMSTWNPYEVVVMQTDLKLEAGAK